MTLESRSLGNITDMFEHITHSHIAEMLEQLGKKINGYSENQVKKKASINSNKNEGK